MRFPKQATSWGCSRRIPQKWISEELSLGFHVFFFWYYRVPELLGFEMFWTFMKNYDPQHVLLTLATAGCWHRNISASVWSTTSWVWRLFCFVEPLGVSCSGDVCKVCHEDFKSPITSAMCAMCCSIKMWSLGKPPGLQYERQICLLFVLEPGQYNLCSEDGQPNKDWHIELLNMF